MRLSRELALGAQSEVHKKMATNSLAESLRGGVSLKEKFTAGQLSAITNGDATIPGYIWHHHQDIGRMQLIPRETHIKTGHIGESLWKRGLDATK